MDPHITIETITIDVAYIKNLLKEKSDFNISYSFNYVHGSGYKYQTTLACYAVENNDEELLDYLIDANVDLNVAAPYGFPLHLAVIKRSMKLVKKLHQAGANVNLRKGNSYLTPLLEAVINNYFQISEYLIHSGADVNAATISYPRLGHTAILIAMSKKYNDIVELLLKHNADPCAEINFSNLNVNVVKNILSTTPAVDVNSIFICKGVLRHNPTTLAHLAVEFKNEELLDYLINSNADLNINIPNQGTVLHVAVKMKDLDVVKKLCKFNVNVDAMSEGKNSGTPLILAIEEGHYKLAEFLLQNGANPNTGSNLYGLNPLHCAINKDYKNIVELLLKNNADPNAKFKSELTPIMHACQIENLDLIKMLIAHGGSYDICDLFRATLRSRTLQVFHYLLASDVDALNNYLKDEKSEEPILHYSLTFSRSSKNYYLPRRSILDYLPDGAIEAILDAGANINCVNNNNQLAVEFTYVFKYLEYIKRHIVKLKQASVYLCQRNIEAVEEGYDNFHTECEQEVIKLKRDNIGTSNLRFYEVLHKSIYTLAIRFVHTNIDDIVDKSKLLEAYPHYGGMIYYKLAKVYRRINLLKTVEKFLDYVLNYSSKLPYTFTRELYLYLTNENLKKLI